MEKITSMRRIMTEKKLPKMQTFCRIESEKVKRTFVCVDPCE